MTFFTRIVFTLSLSLFALCAQAHSTALTERDDVKQFIQEMVDKHHFDTDNLVHLLGQARIQPSIIDAMERPYEAKPWHDYRRLFVTQKHIDNGVAFWKANHDTLERAEATYGVDQAIIVAILGIETRYGSYTGHHKVLDALVTLGFEYPKRGKFFRSELEQYLLLLDEEHLDPSYLKGSYAGAIGMPQFIPSSYRHYAVDFSHSGKRDLFGDVEDVIGSVANYFHQHGWDFQGPVATPTYCHADIPDTFIADPRKPSPRFQQEDLAPLKLYFPAHWKNETVSFMIFEGTEDHPAEYWLGAKNFYVITRYNHSQLYAMAAFQLSEALKAAYHS